MGTTTQKNVYIKGPPAQNITNMANNVEWNSLGLDQTIIEVDFTGSPAQVTVKQGSWIELNGNRYLVEVDEVFTMNSASDNYITFNETGTTWASTTTKGTYNDSKAGVYQADNVTRTIRWYVDQTEETYNLDDSLQSYNIGDLKTEVNSYAMDGTASKGVQLYTATGISASHNSDAFYLYKPTTLVVYTDADMRQRYPTGAGAVTMPYWQLYIDVEYNGGWNAFMDIGVSGYTDTVNGNSTRTLTDYLVPLNPGRYRVSLIKNPGGTSGPYDLDVYLIGVYGQTNLDAGSVYV